MTESYSVTVTDFKETPETFEWRIPKQQIVGVGETLRSREYFKTGRTWRLQLERCGHYIALKIGLVSSRVLPIMVNYRFYCCSTSDGNVYLQVNTWIFEEFDTFQGPDKFFSYYRQKSNYIEDYYANSTLKILCEVEVFHINKLLVRSPSPLLNQQQIVPAHPPQSDFIMLLDAGHFNVTLVAGDNKFRAHKNVLSARSPIFARMFQVDMKEKTTSTIVIDDIDTETLQKMLLNIYSGDTPLLNTAADKLIVAKLRGREGSCESEAELPSPAVDGCEEAKKLLYAADKYQIEGLVKCCEKYLSEHLTVDNVAETALLANRHNAGQLRRSCSVFIVEHRSAVAKTSKWSELLTEIGIIRDMYETTVEKYEAPAPKRIIPADINLDDL